MYFTLYHILLVSAGLVLGVSAKPPKKPSVGQFKGLILQSPFTIKPSVEVVKAESPLERDWMLGSIRPSGSGYSVTLINKKDRKKRIRFLPGFSSGEFKLLEVKQDGTSNKNSKVRIGKGSQTAWITYDEKLIKIKPAKVSTQKNTASGGPPIPGRTSRVRRVPKAKPNQK